MAIKKYEKEGERKRRSKIGKGGSIWDKGIVRKNTLKYE
jgi:hypothetical protein